METPNWFLFSCLLLLTSPSGGGRFVESIRLGKDVSAFTPEKLFVFGDSYADTGNDRKSVTSSWKFPYGITFPGKPTGRFSDGVVSTDHIAKYLKLRTPVPYRFWKQLEKRLKYGLNFAYGGTGVFDTLVLEPNMTTQIDFLQKLVNDSVYTKKDLNSSVALLSLSGNDYSNYIQLNGSAQGFPAFIKSVVDQLGVNMKRLHDMGARRVAVNTLQPLGCLPRSTYKFSFQKCNATENALVDLHNLLLNQTVAKLNAETSANSFVIIDLHTAFFEVFNNTNAQQGQPKFQNPYMTCCVGTSTQYSCGSVDGNGTKMYTMCAEPKSTFFWDNVHPTQQGWHAVFATPTMKKSLEQL